MSSPRKVRRSFPSALWAVVAGCLTAALILSIAVALSTSSKSSSAPSAPPSTSASTGSETTSESPGPALADAGFGAFVPTFPNTGPATRTAFEESVGRDVVASQWFVAWGASWGAFTAGPGDTTTTRLDVARGGGRTAVITWEPWDPSQGADQPEYSTQSISAGTHDRYIQSWAEGLAAYGAPVSLRLMHEMNSDWYPWAGGANGNTSQAYVAAWMHVHDLFVAAGADNVDFVWSVNNYDIDGAEPLEKYWPGEAYVGIVALDGYNCYRGWTSPEDLLSDSYDRIVRLAPELPVWITEVGSCEASDQVSGSEGHTKAAWVEELFTSTRFPAVDLVLWFNEDKAHDWSVDSSPASLNAFRSVLAS